MTYVVMDMNFDPPALAEQPPAAADHPVWVPISCRPSAPTTTLATEEPAFSSGSPPKEPGAQGAFAHGQNSGLLNQYCKNVQSINRLRLSRCLYRQGWAHSICPTVQLSSPLCSDRRIMPKEQ